MHTPESSSTFRQLFQTLSTINEDHDNRRAGVRSPCSLAAIIEPLDADFQRKGDPFYVTSRDITDQGIGFVNPVKVDEDYVRVELVDHKASLIGRVRHNTNVGSHLPLYLVGVQFLGMD